MNIKVYIFVQGRNFDEKCGQLVKLGELTGTKKKAELYYKGRENHNNNAVAPTFRGKFTKCCVLENPEYKKFKLKTLEQSIQVAKEPRKMSPTEAKRQYMKQIILSNQEIGTTELSKILGVSDRLVRLIKAEERDRKKEDK